MAECFYCGTDTKLTRAHLFHQDIRAALPNESTEVTLAASSAGGGLVQDLIYTGDVRELNVKKLCDPCNRLWMEPIERAASPIIEALMGGLGAPPPKDLFRLAHWATIVGALATQTGPSFDIPVEHRREIRFTRTGQPRNFGTHLILTLDTYPGTQFDFMRFESEPGATDGGASWFSALHAGPVVIVSAEFTVNTMIARELHYSGFESYLGAVSSNLACIPPAIRNGRALVPGLNCPTHFAVQTMCRSLAGPDVSYVDTAHGGSLVSTDTKTWTHPKPFDYDGTLVDMRSQLDLSYLDGVFEA